MRTDCSVERILIEQGRATGVVLRRGSVQETLRAAGGVALCAGAFNSPQLLMLSGIGPGAHLAEHGITVARECAAVGADLQDHIDYVASFETQSRDFIGDSLAGSWAMARAVIEHRLRRTGRMTTPYAESGGFWRSRPDAPAAAAQALWLARRCARRHS